MTNPPGSSTSALLQKQMSFKSSVGANLLSKTDEIEVIESNNIEGVERRYNKNNTLGWICCAPCIWLHTSTTVHKIAITTATLLVTSLLVASPIIFLISTAPSQLPKDCYSDDEECMPTIAPPPECIESVCRLAATSIQSKLNWNLDPCSEFKNFSCSSIQGVLGSGSLKSIRSAQESVDLQMQKLLQHNTASGPFRKLGRLFGSCLKQSTNSSTIQLVLEQLGGYLPIGALGPSSVANLITKLFKIGPTPLVDIYYDLSYGKRPHVLLIISGPSSSSPVLENKIRWFGPKAPPYRRQSELPKLLNDLLDSFLPFGLTTNQKQSENEAISTFIKELYKINEKYNRRGFWDSSVLYNTSTLQEMYPILNWSDLIPNNWSGPIVVRSSEYLRAIDGLLTKYPTRVAHNSILLLFALGILPKDRPNPAICTRSIMWALPEAASALYIAQYSSEDLDTIMRRAESIFKTLKAHLKRAPSLKGAALVKLSALKMQTMSWNWFRNISGIILQLESIEITSDNWFENILKIYQRNMNISNIYTINMESHGTRMDILIHSGGMQIAYHSLLSLTGPLKGMARLPGLNLTPTQIFFLVSAQELCVESDYRGIETHTSDFEEILGWLIAQGGSASEVFKCPSGSMINAQKTCNVL